MVVVVVAGSSGSKVKSSKGQKVKGHLEFRVQPEVTAHPRLNTDLGLNPDLGVTFDPLTF